MEMVQNIAPYDLLFVTQPPKLVLRAVEWARFISIDGGETAVIGFACTSGFAWGVVRKTGKWVVGRVRWIAPIIFQTQVYTDSSALLL